MKFLLFLIILIFCRIESQVAVDLFYCYFIRFLNYTSNMGFPRWHSGKESTCQCRNCRDVGLISGSGRSSGVGNGNPL